MSLLRLLNPLTSIRARLALAIGGLSIGLTLIVATSVDNFMSEHLQLATQSKLRSISHQLSEALDRGLYESRRDVIGISQIDELQNPAVPIAQKRTLLGEIHGTYPDYAWIGILNPNGTVAVATGGLGEGLNKASEPIFVNGRKGAWVGDVHTDPILSPRLSNGPNQPGKFIDISTPIYDFHGKYRGVVAAYLNWQWVRNEQTMLQDAGDLPRAYDVLVIARGGNVSATDPRLMDGSSLTTTDFFARAVNPKNYVSASSTCIGYRDFTGLGWSVVARQRLSLALAPAQSLHRSILESGLLIGLLTLVISWIMADRITRPLVRTANAAEAIHPGEAKVDLPIVPGNDELARLSASLRRMVDGLRTSDERYRNLLDTSLEGICLVDADDKTTYANASLAQMLGYDQTKLIGMSIYNLVFPDEIAETVERRARRRKGIAEQYEMRLKGNGDKEIWTLASITPIFEDEGEHYAGTFVMVIDITERRRAEKALEAAYDRQVLISEIALTLRDSADPVQIQRSALRQLGEAIKADSCIFMIADSITDIVRLEAQWQAHDQKPFPAKFDFNRLKVSAERLFPDRGTFVACDIALHSLGRELDATLVRYGLRSCCIVPLYDRERLIAALGVYRKSGPYNWTADEVSLIELVATQVRSAVDTARVTLREHRIATVLQNALQPTKIHQIPGLDIATYNKPALDEASIGGDFFDIFPIDDHRHAIVIADVSGKGLSAAVQVATVRNMLRFVLYAGRTVDRAASELDEVFYRHRLLNGFVTLFISVYDSDARTLEYVSSGHEPMLIYKRAADKVIELDATGPPLGVDPNSQYIRHCVDLESGDLMLFYTDGLSEAGPDRMHMMGTEGLVNLLCEHGPTATSAHALRLRLMRCVEEYANDHLRDDACMIATIVR